MDNNKGIGSVEYTHFNKPQATIFSNDKRIEYSYDAAGNKVQELLIDPTANPATKRTDYIGNNVYENDKVQYLLTGNGRTTFDPANGVPKEEFFVKDHLGNVRSVVDVYTYLTQEYMASYEIASAHIENMYFETVDEVRDDRPGATWNGDLKSARLNGADPERRVGTSLLVHVMAGDKVELNVNNFYEGYSAEEDNPLPAEEMLGSIINTLVQGPGGTLPGEGHDVEQVTNAFNWPNFEQFHNMVEGGTDPSKSKAYLNYILFDEQMRMVNSASGAFQANGDGNWTQIGTTAPMEVPANGYLAVYLSNSSVSGCLACNDVFFDQLVVRFTRGKLKEEVHYYPHGLPINGMGSAAAGFVPNRRKYQSNEYIKDFGLNWMDFQARQYDPQLGRFLAVDPLADGQGQEIWSPYAAMGNAPESMIDPNGESATTFTGAAAVSAFSALQGSFGSGMFVNGSFKDYGNIALLLSDAMSRGISGSSIANVFLEKQSRSFFDLTMGSIGSAGGGSGVAENDLTEEGDGDDGKKTPMGPFSEADPIITGETSAKDASSWMDIAESQLGVKEKTNNNDGPEVEMYLKSGGLGKGYPWCGAFVNWVLLEAGIGVVGVNNNPNWALNWRGFGTKLDAPAFGAIATKTRNGGGHVGFVAGTTKDGRVVILGGNQNDAVNYQAYPVNTFQYNFPSGYSPMYNLPTLNISSGRVREF